MKDAIWVCIILLSCISGGVFIGCIEIEKRLDQLEQNQADDHAILESKLFNIEHLEKKVDEWKKEFYLKERED